MPLPKSKTRANVIREEAKDGVVSEAVGLIRQRVGGELSIAKLTSNYSDVCVLLGMWLQLPGLASPPFTTITLNGLCSRSYLNLIIVAIINDMACSDTHTSIHTYEHAFQPFAPPVFS